MSSVLFAVKKKIAPTIHELSYISGFSNYRACRQPGIRVIMYHGVGGADCPAEAFELQMQYLAKNLSTISFETAIEKTSDPEYNFHSEVVLTFDDGLLNNLTVAYPILQRYSLPATFFVCPGLIETGKWLWAYEVEQRLHILSDGEFFNLLRHLDPEGMESDSNRQEYLEHIIEWMKTLDTDYRQTVEEKLRKLTSGFKPTPTQSGFLDTMSYENLRSLSPELITIGSHSVNHPMLTKVSTDEMQNEIRDSKKILEEQLQRPIEYFCYPNGSHNSEIVNAVKSHYIAAVSTEHGLFSKGDDIYLINRIPAAQNLAYFAWRMSRPGS